MPSTVNGLHRMRASHEAYPQKVSIIDSWKIMQEDLFENLKRTIADATSISFPKRSYTTCLFTGASDSLWSAEFAQCKEE